MSAKRRRRKELLESWKGKNPGVFDISHKKKEEIDICRKIHPGHAPLIQ